MPGQWQGEPGQGAAAFVFDERGRLLLVRENYDRRRYGPPGGRVEPGEDPLDAVVREAREEAGIEVAVEHLIGIYRLENGFSAYAFPLPDRGGDPGGSGRREAARSPKSAGTIWTRYRGR